MRARQMQSQTARVFLNRKQERFNAFPYAITFKSNLFFWRKKRRRPTHVHKHIATLHPLHGTRNNLAFAVLKLIKYRLAFCFAYSLNNYLLSCLRGNTSKILMRFQRKREFFSCFYVFFDFTRFRKHNVPLRIISNFLRLAFFTHDLFFFILLFFSPSFMKLLFTFHYFRFGLPKRFFHPQLFVCFYHRFIHHHLYL